MRPMLIHHADCLEHHAGPGHPERPERLIAAIAGVRNWGGEVIEREAPLASASDLAGVHDPAYVSAIEEFCATGGGRLDQDTAAVEASWSAALRAAGAGLAALDAIDEGECEVAFLAVRPPGHHALTARAMGFCLFNNIAVAADRVRVRGGRPAIVDWDVHHGNGTQDTFYGDGDVLYLSLHEFPFYPGTGRVDEMGRGEGRGFTINLPMPSGSAGDAYRDAFSRVVIPVLEEFAPTHILVSAGFDAHRSDPLAGLQLEAGDYQAMAASLARFDLPTIYFLEGGYDLAAIEASVAATLRGAAGQSSEPGETRSPRRAFDAIDAACAIAADHWSGVQDR